MKTTNEMIHDLVAREFELPEGLKWQRDINAWVLEGSGTCADCTFEVSDAVAHDLISAAFARQNENARWAAFADSYARERGGTVSPRDGYTRALTRGDSEAAIRALWEAVGGGE